MLRRGDGIYSYQLAVVVDDLEMEIDEVVRGADLLGSTPRQILLARLLGGIPPRFAHAPLVVDANGARLAKRARGIVLADHRQAGHSPGAVVALLARTLGLLADGEEADGLRPRDLLGGGRLERLRGRSTATLPGEPFSETGS